MKFPKLNFEKLMQELNIQWILIELCSLLFIYIVGKSFLHLFTSLYGWILLAFSVAIVVSPEFNNFVKEKIMLMVNKFGNMESIGQDEIHSKNHDEPINDGPQRSKSTPN